MLLRLLSLSLQCATDQRSLASVAQERRAGDPLRPASRILPLAARRRAGQKSTTNSWRIKDARDHQEVNQNILHFIRSPPIPPAIMKFASVLLFAALMGVSVQAATVSSRSLFFASILSFQLHRIRRTPPAEVAAPVAAQAAEREAQILEQAKKVEERVKDETQATLEAAQHGGPTINRPGIAIASPAAPAPAPALVDAQPNVQINRQARQSGDLAHDVADAQARDRTNTNVALTNVRAQSDAERIR